MWIPKPLQIGRGDPVKDEQSQKLRALFEHARRSTAAYANRLPDISTHLPVDPVDLLNLVEPLSRQELQQERVRLYSTVGDASSWRVARTTGTTGEPAEVVLDSRSRGVEASMIADHFDQLPISDEWRKSDLMHLVMHPGATSRSVPSPWSANARVAKWNLIRVWQASDSEFIKSMQYLNRNIVTTMPSVAELLYARIQDAGMSEPIRPLLFLLSGETVEPAIQAQVAKVFACPVTALYVVTEAGIVGRSCPDKGGYHEATKNVLLEIVDADGRAVTPGTEGEILVTPLENYAMPLLRYRTGDRGRWEKEACSCGNAESRLTLASARRPVRLSTAAGVGVNPVRFAKVLASLDLQRYNISQGEDGSVTISYAAVRQLDVASRALIIGTVRTALGPEVTVRLRHVHRNDQVDPGDRPGPQLNLSEGPRSVEPDGLEATAIQEWLKRRLAGLEGGSGIQCAVLTGSALDPESSSRFSDVDLVILVHDEPVDPRWIELSKELRVHLPTLSVNVDQLAGLSRRAPLTACRLLCEQLPVIGSLDATVLAWPSAEDLKAQGRLWAQDAFAVLWHKLTSPAKMGTDPLPDAWLASKYALNALRYYYLSRGGKITAARDIISRAMQDRDSLPWLDDLLESFDVARELRPPPIPTAETVGRYLAAALFCIRFVRAGL